LDVPYLSPYLKELIESIDFKLLGNDPSILQICLTQQPTYLESVVCFLLKSVNHQQVLQADAAQVEGHEEGDIEVDRQVHNDNVADYTTIDGK
jgi:hypothetical protein